MRQVPFQVSGLQVAVAEALGVCNDDRSTPYINYIQNQYRDDYGSLEEHLRFFIAVIKFFLDMPSAGIEESHSPASDSIQACVQHICNACDLELPTSSQSHDVDKSKVLDLVMHALGVWTAMSTSFRAGPGGHREILDAYKAKKGRLREKGYDVELKTPLKSVVSGSGLLHPANANSGPEPSDELATKLLLLISKGWPDLDATSRLKYYLNNYIDFGHDMDRLRYSNSLELLSISATKLNIYTLAWFAGVDIRWTRNLSHHLILTQVAGRHYLEIFILPCVLRVRRLQVSGVSQEFMDEIQRSYALLFNPWPEKPLHAAIGSCVMFRYWCWCKRCLSFQRRRKYIHALKAFGTAIPTEDVLDTYDPHMELLMNDVPRTEWLQEVFPNLWQRIMILDEHQGRIKPWNFWVLFRDKRDTLQYWTFFFATFIVILTTIQVVLSIAQVVGSFKP